jgi:hypothetical protein
LVQKVRRRHNSRHTMDDDATLTLTTTTLMTRGWSMRASSIAVSTETFVRVDLFPCVSACVKE